MFIFLNLDVEIHGCMRALNFFFGPIDFVLLGYLDIYILLQTLADIHVLWIVIY